MLVISMAGKGRVVFRAIAFLARHCGNMTLEELERIRAKSSPALTLNHKKVHI